MLKELHAFKPMVGLVPRSGVQFLDFAFVVDAVKTRRAFWDEPRPDGTAVLRPLTDEDGEYVYWDEAARASRQPDRDGVYEFNAVRALEPFLGKWVPVPFLRVEGGGLARGPSNWARARVVELPERDPVTGHSHRIILAFDTATRVREEGDAYLAPAPGEVQEYAFAPSEQDCAWLLAESWMDRWLAEMWVEKEQARRPNRPLREEELAFGCKHLAAYLTLLRVLDDLSLFPRVRLLDVAAANRFGEAVDVDLVLDVGNSRTCGLLIESTPDTPPGLQESYALELRDLSRPESAYSEPFSSHVEFARASFGRDGLSRESGRSDAFSWPSVVRIGPEAFRLAASARGTEGATGLSSPKRYLWDERQPKQVWRFNAAASGEPGRTEPPVSGPILSHVSDTGDVLSLKRGSGAMALRPTFCRSSLFTFLLLEVLMQALSFVNSPALRASRKNEDAPRRLRRLVLTLPPGMPVAEQRRFRERAEAAVALLRDLMGESVGRITVITNLDEATCTQVAFLYDQITTGFRGDAALYFSLWGKARGGAGQASLRVASIDIGGGTTDLSIITYTMLDNRMLVPEQNFREGFKLAGDDVVETVVMRHVVPALARHLAACGMADPRPFLLELFTGPGDSEPERQRRRRFTAQVLLPVALGLLQDYERWNPLEPDETVVRGFDSFFARMPKPGPEVLAFLEDRVRDAGVTGFRLADVTVPVDHEGLHDAVRLTLGPVLTNLCEVVHALDCDLLLLSGRPSRFPAVEHAVLAHVPVTPDRVQAMHRYQVGPWYPFRDARGRINDPKTTAAVGAMLCVLAEGHLENFALRASLLRLSSTARYIGEMELNGQIRRDRVLFTEADQAASNGQPAQRPLAFYTKAFLGFRQLDVERWPGTPLYALEFRHPDSAARLQRPLTLTLERVEADPDDPRAEEKREGLLITEVMQADGSPALRSDVVIRLQTLKSEEGYWLDTGRLDTLDAALGAVEAVG